MVNTSNEFSVLHLSDGWITERGFLPFLEAVAGSRLWNTGTAGDEGLSEA
jgi:hypothetical protein